MAYYFMLENKKGSWEKLNIPNSKYFRKSSRYKQYGACSLEEIDYFTMMFDDEEELRMSLLKEGILTPDNINKPLSIRLPRRDTFKKVMYDFLYQKDLIYIADPKRIIDKINDFNHQNNFHFLEKFATNYQDFHECNSSASELKMASIYSKKNNTRSKYLNTLDNEGHTLPERVAYLLLYEHRELSSCDIIYYPKIKYANLHSLVAFINHYEKKYLTEMKPLTNEQIALLEFKPLTKTKKKKNPILKGQYNLFNE